MTAFEKCVDALRELGSVPTKRKPKKAPTLEQREAAQGQLWAYTPVEKMPSPGKVVESLSFVSDEDLEFDAIKQLDEPNTVVSSSLWLGVGAWNASDEEASWAGERGAWMVIQAELSREEDGDTVDVVFAAWRVDGGLALFVTPLEDGVERAAAVSGLPIADREEWDEDKVFYGE
ncbi:MAG TPA: hypothetical protein VGM39_21125 [Kofleriaceae bacterium]|jgi:hypothetical protein